MIVWFRIQSNPPRQFCFNSDALPYVDPKQATHDILSDAGTLSLSTGGQNASVTLTLRNTSGQASALFADPPHGATVELFDGAEPLFAGALTQVDVSSTDCKLTVQG